MSGLADRGVDIRFNVDGVGRLAFGMEQWANAIRDWRPIFRDFHTILEHHMRRVFDSEGAINRHGKWPAEEPTRRVRRTGGRPYNEWKADHFPGNKILVLTGALRMSLTLPVHAAAVRMIGPDSMVFGTAVPYAIKHQLGLADADGPKVHQRRLFDWSQDISHREYGGGTVRRISLPGALAQMAHAHVLVAAARNGLPTTDTLARLTGQLTGARRVETF